MAKVGDDDRVDQSDDQREASRQKQIAGGATGQWTPSFTESVSLGDINLAAGSTLRLPTPGTAAELSPGWGELDAEQGVSGYAIFTYKSPGQQDQDATSGVDILTTMNFWTWSFTPQYQ